jgi:hypothetical protein
VHRIRSFALVAAFACAVTPAATAIHKPSHRTLLAPPADCSMATIPAARAHGMIGGKPFALGGASLSQSGTTVGGANYDTYLLTLEAPDGAGATMVIVVTASVPQGQTLDGKTFRRVASLDATQQPQAGPGEAQIPDFGIEYNPAQVDVDNLSAVAAIRLEFGTRAGGKLPAKIYLCQPDGKGNVFAGTFTLDTDQD